MYKDEEEYVLRQLKAHSGSRAKFSDVLVNQIAGFLRERQFNIFQIFDVIKSVEDDQVKSKKGVRFFKRDVLKDFQYVHWTDARFIGKNLQAFWGIREEHSAQGELSPKLKQYIENLLVKRGVKRGEPIPGDIVNELSHGVVHESYFSKSQRGELTGEWIIFKTIENANFYYAIAFHYEDDLQIKERLLSAIFI